MALQPNDSEHGSWVTENVTIQALVSANDPPTTAREDCRPPECGLLTRTVIESPVVQWILPARIRSAAHNDVVFIGVCFAVELPPYPIHHLLPNLCLVEWNVMSCHTLLSLSSFLASGS